MQNCIFCKIINGDIPSHTVYEDEATFAFLDINPNTKGHTLVIPKRHCETVVELPERDACALMRTMQKLIPAVRDGAGADGLNVGINNGPAAGQEVFHAHLHLIPRTEGDGLKHWPKTSYEEGEEEKIARAIAENISR